MPVDTLPAFDANEQRKANLFLATQISEMMGRKFEEGDWAKIYSGAKGIPLRLWSNLSIDVMHGNLGVEHKMLCRPEHQSMMEVCGTTLMHPAGTRSIRIPDEKDATVAARNVLQQYVEIVEGRTSIVKIVNDYNHGLFERAEAISALRTFGMGQSSAEVALPRDRTPIGDPDAKPDMRMG